MNRTLKYIALSIVMMLLFSLVPGGAGVKAEQQEFYFIEGAPIYVCDDCQDPPPEPEELYFTIMHTNDEHSALVPSPFIDYRPGEENPALGGFARLATLVNSLREEKATNGEEVLLVNAGDFLGGAAYGWLALEGYAAELTLMQELGYDVVIIGNHEYDYGPEVLAEYMKVAGYPQAHDKTAVLASNTRPPAGHPLNDAGLKETHIIELENGLRIGFFGLIGYDAVDVAPYSAPVEFPDPIETAGIMVQRLQDAGVDVIIAVTHAGLDESITMVQQVPGIDVIVDGHCHTLLEQPVVEGKTIIVQAGELMKHVGVLELAYNPETQTLRVRNEESGQPFVVPLDWQVDSDPAMAQRVAYFTDRLNEVVADMTDGRFTDISETVVWSDFVVTNRPRLEETPFGNFITDAMRLVAQEVTGERVHLAFQANGVIRGAIEPGSMPWARGQVSFYDLADLVGLGSGPDGHAGYPMVSIYFTGEEIRRIFEVQVLLGEMMGDTYFLQISGGRITYDKNRAILMTIPFLDQAIPTALLPLPVGAVLSGQLYTGEGIQDDNDANYMDIVKGDETLYHVVTDFYIASFLPMVGDLLPNLELIIKDKAGNPIDIDDLEKTIIYRDGRELKVWQAVIEYAAAQPPDSQGNPRIPDYYQQTAGRLNQKWTIPLMLWPGLLLAGIVGGIVLRRRRRARKQQQAA